ncbi:Melanocortin receptor 5 [Frankliniella fusca]|uniref:Melanocortin receptor 5 n=1 Tax=Frankliniella fusca TaxID=407009 RepID=A0AAE1HU63_9NEOP|nr:Melanocortin receptor 5 [Frankliniella fusca]
MGWGGVGSSRRLDAPRNARPAALSSSTAGGAAVSSAPPSMSAMATLRTAAASSAPPTNLAATLARLTPSAKKTGEGLMAYNDSSPDGPGLAVVDVIDLERAFPYIMMGFSIVEYTLMVLMVVGNLFILVAYAVGRIRGKNSTLRLPSSGRLVLNLALADLLVGLGLIYFSIFKFWPELAARLARYQVPCVLRFSICFMTMFGSHCALLLVAVDRYTAIVHTLHYKEYLTTRVSWMAIVGGWFVPVAGAGSVFAVNQWHPDVPFCDEHHVVPNFLIMFALPSNVFVLLAISLTHWRVHREVQAFTLRASDPSFVASASSSARRSHGCRKSAVLLLRVTTSFIVCWTPLDVMLTLFVVLGPRLWVLVAFEGAFLLGMTSFLLNPFVYAWKTEAIRRPLIAALIAVRVLPRSGLAARRQPGPDPHPYARPGPARVFTIGHSRSRASLSHSSTSGAGSASSASGQTVHTTIGT